MSRTKSAKTLQRERGECKRAERDARRAARAERAGVRAHVAAVGVPKIKPEGSRFGLREALAYSGLMDCDRCHRITRDKDLMAGVCELCQYSEGEAPEQPAGGPGPTAQLALFD